MVAWRDDKEGKDGSRIKNRIAARKARKSSSIVKTNMTGSIKEGKLTFVEFLLQEMEANLPKEWFNWWYQPLLDPLYAGLFLPIVLWYSIGIRFQCDIHDVRIG